MGLLFDRAIEVVVFAGGKSYTIRDLHMTFDIIANRRSKPNQAKIGIYNLSETSRNLLEEKHQGIEFKAGYQKEPVLIFRGTTNNIVNRRAAPDWYTEIYAGDGQKEFNSAHFNKAYAAGTPVKQILRDLTNALGLPSEIDDQTVGDVLAAGLALSGRVKDCLDQVTADYGLAWSIQHGTVEIVVEGEPPVKDSSAVVLRADTGLIGSPELTEDGVKVRSLLNPAIRPSRLIKIESQDANPSFGKLMEKAKPKRNANGIYIVDVAHYQGDNFGGPFDVTAESKFRT